MDPKRYQKEASLFSCQSQPFDPSYHGIITRIRFDGSSGLTGRHFDGRLYRRCNSIIHPMELHGKGGERGFIRFFFVCPLTYCIYLERGSLG